VFRKKLLKTNRIGLIPVGGNADNSKQNRKALAWLMQ
jgi:hypothetical protein